MKIYINLPFGYKMISINFFTCNSLWCLGRLYIVYPVASALLTACLHKSLPFPIFVCFLHYLPYKDVFWCRSEVVTILKEVVGHTMPLFMFIELYEKRYVVY